MAKNITVLDAHGNEYEATYPRRAKGLVKAGRARFIDETTICLTAPPAHTEGNSMNMQDILQNNTADADAPAGAQPDMAFVMQKIDQILSDTQYLKDAISRLGDADEQKCRALTHMIECRETTNQAAIRLLEKMLDGICQPPAPNPQAQNLGMLLQFMSERDMDDEYAADAVNQIIQRLL